MTDLSQLSDEERHLATMKEIPTNQPYFCKACQLPASGCECGKSQTPKLKPCLCGKVPTYELFDGDGFRLPRVKWEQIKCKCGISTEPEQPGCRTPDLVARWNTRADRDQLRARVSELEREAKSNHEMWVHWQTEATKLGGELFETNRAARTYENAFNVALQQRDAATEALKRARVALQAVINSAVEPEKAKFACMVPLAPIRAALAAAETEKPSAEGKSEA